MSSITQYQSLKNDGTSIDRRKYLLALKDKNEIEKYLKESSKTSYVDLQMFIFLSNLTKNDRNLLEIFQEDSLPIKQRVSAGKCWINLQKDPKQVENLLVEIINNKTNPRSLKSQILRSLHRIQFLKKSPSFFSNLCCRLSENNSHDEYNIDAHLFPYCSKDEMFDLLSRWSFKSLKQLQSSSAFYSKLIHLQPSIIIHLMKEDLNQLKNNQEKYFKYFEENNQICELIIKNEAKELISLFIEYLNGLDKHQRYLPHFVSSKGKYLFQKLPNQMIDLITIVASNQPGSIKYRTDWGSTSDLGSFSFPRSFSVENFVELFFVLYDECGWSSNHFIRILQYMLENSDTYQNLYSISKERKWFWDIVINEKIGKEIFLEKLLKQGNEQTLELLHRYPQLTNSLSIHLLSKLEKNGIVKPEKRLSLIRYQLMTKDLFELFLSLFKQTGSIVNQRQQNYVLFLQSAILTDQFFSQNVIQWIEKRFTNEQLVVIQYFLDQIFSFDQYFQLKILPNNFQSIENLLDFAINHLQRSTSTLISIINYGIHLLKLTEQCKDKQNIQTFAIQIIKKCFSKNDNAPYSLSSIDESYPQTRQLMINILISDVFPRLVSKSMLDELNNILSSYVNKSKCIPSIDAFIEEFFTKSLSSSPKLQSSFHIDKHSSMIKLFLQNKSTRYERINYLINHLDQLFFIDQNIQTIALRSQQHRSLIDRLIQDDKSFVLDKLSNERSLFLPNLNSITKNVKLPGLHVDVLNTSQQFLTGKQQEHITNIILNDYLQDSEVPNLNKLKSLGVLRRLTHTYHQTLQWIDKKQGESSSLVAKNTDEGTNHRNRGAAVQPLDDIIICFPTTCDLNPKILIEQFHLLTKKLNSANAKFISDALKNISRKIPDQIFLTNYFEFIENDEFKTLGITANKEILRLLIDYTSDSNIIEQFLQPFWTSQPHQDIRACLILILIHFIEKTNSIDHQIILWKILDQAANDEYILIIQYLFGLVGGRSTQVLSKLKNSSPIIYEKFVNQIQFQILDHPKSLAARSIAWTHIDYEYVQIDKFIEKAQQLCITFNRDENQLWESAFQKLLSLFQQPKISSIQQIFEIIEKMMSRREEIDSKENALDNRHDLPVYHRIQRILTILNSNINQFDYQKKNQFSSLNQIILKFDKTLSPLIGTLAIQISQNKDDLENILQFLQENLPENYFQGLVIQLGKVLFKSDCCPFIQQLNVDQKLQLAQWFIQEKNRPLFVWNLLTNQVFNQAGVDRIISQDLIRQIRTNENLFLRQQAMEYTVPWNDQNNLDDDDDQMSVSNQSDIS